MTKHVNVSSSFERNNSLQGIFSFPVRIQRTKQNDFMTTKFETSFRKLSIDFFLSGNSLRSKRATHILMKLCLTRSLLHVLGIFLSPSHAWFSVAKDYVQRDVSRTDFQKLRGLKIEETQICKWFHESLGLFDFISRVEFRSLDRTKSAVVAFYYLNIEERHSRIIL